MSVWFVCVFLYGGWNTLFKWLVLNWGKKNFTHAACPLSLNLKPYCHHEYFSTDFCSEVQFFHFIKLIFIVFIQSLFYYNFFFKLHYFIFVIKLEKQVARRCNMLSFLMSWFAGNHLPIYQASCIILKITWVRYMHFFCRYDYGI